MADEHIECPVIDDLGYIPCDDGSEIKGTSTTGDSHGRRPLRFPESLFCA
jgi:hypothetical protein